MPLTGSPSKRGSPSKGGRSPLAQQDALALQPQVGGAPAPKSDDVPSIFPAAFGSFYEPKKESTSPPRAAAEPPASSPVRTPAAMPPASSPVRTPTRSPEQRSSPSPVPVPVSVPVPTPTSSPEKTSEPPEETPSPEPSPEKTTTPEKSTSPVKEDSDGIVEADPVQTQEEMREEAEKEAEEVLLDDVPRAEEVEQQKERPRGSPREEQHKKSSLAIVCAIICVLAGVVLIAILVPRALDEDPAVQVDGGGNPLVPTAAPSFAELVTPFECSEAITVGANSTTAGSNKGAPALPDVPVCSGLADNGFGVWFQLEGDGNVYKASTCDPSTDFDTQISIFSGTCSKLECVAANDQGSEEECGSQSQVEFSTNPDVIYYLFVHGKREEEGQVVLNLEQVSQDNDSCDNAGPVAPSGTDEVIGNTWAAATSGNEANFTCSESTVPGLWYAIQGQGRDITISTCSESTKYNADISIAAGTSCSELTCAETTSEECLAPLQGAIKSFFGSAGSVFYVLIHGSDAAQASSRSSRQLQDGGPADSQFGMVIRDDVGPSGFFVDVQEACTATGAIEIDGTAASSVLYQTSNTLWDSFCDGSGQGDFYQITGEGSAVTADTCNNETTIDTTLSVVVGDCVNQIWSCIASNDRFCGDQSLVKWVAEVGVNYYLLVRSSGSNQGNYALTVTTAASPAPTTTPSDAPSSLPTTPAPTQLPTLSQTSFPTFTPSTSPTLLPTASDSVAPTGAPTITSTAAPTPTALLPTTVAPTRGPTVAPDTSTPTAAPTIAPITSSPTLQPTRLDSSIPTPAPSVSPPTTSAPTNTPTTSPTLNPTVSPTPGETNPPTALPTPSPTPLPTPGPTSPPTARPTPSPTPLPTPGPTTPPTPSPTPIPTPQPSPEPTNPPTPSPTPMPTPQPTPPPTNPPTGRPTTSPTGNPTPMGPTLSPVASPTSTPSSSPTYVIDPIEQCNAARTRDALGSSDSVAIVGAGGDFTFSPELEGSCGASSFDNSAAIWFRLDGSRTGPNIIASAELCNVVFDLQLTVFSGDCDQLTCVTGVSDFCFQDARWEWGLSTTTYYLMFHGFGAMSGNFVFNVDSQ